MREAPEAQNEETEEDPRVNRALALSKVNDVAVTHKGISRPG